METSQRAILVAGALIVGAAAAAFAHDTWILPADLRTPAGKEVVLHLTSGMAFPTDDFTIDPTRIIRASARQGRITMPFGRPKRGKTAALYTWTPKDPGLATIVVSLSPKDLELTEVQVKEYLDEINASPATRSAWEKMPAPRKWRERYSKNAKTYVCVEAKPGAGCTDSSWKAPNGLLLEIVPLANPAALHAGDSLPVAVLRAGTPVVGFNVGAQHAGEPGTTFATTDNNGRAFIRFPRDGKWLLNGTHLRRATAKDREWDSDFTTLTLFIMPK